MSHRISIIIFLLNSLAFGQVTVSLPDENVSKGNVFSIPITVSDVTGQGIESFSFKIVYDGAVLNLTGVDRTGSLTDGWAVIVNADQSNTLLVAGSHFTALSGIGVLLNVEAVALDAGSSTLSFETITFNEGSPVAESEDGSVISTSNQAPNSIITSPEDDLIIPSGASVYIAGSSDDPDGSESFTYAWDFGGAAPAGTEAIPGEIAFDNAGVYVITFTVTDDLGVADPTPDTRTITVVDGSPPDSVITSPAADIAVTPGASISFSGQASDPDDIAGVSYSWNFGGLAADSDLQNPSPVTFPDIGEYEIWLTVTDSTGLIDSTPARRRVIVSYNQAPNGTIISPAEDMTLLPGSSISCQGTAVDPDGGSVRVSWDFGGAAPGSNSLEPGLITFSEPGTYVITLHVSDGEGMTDPSPAQRIITVPDPESPNGVINQPLTDMAITAGDSISFASSGDDPDGDFPLHFSWDFGGGAPNSALQNPGAVVFEQPGTFVVTLQVHDSERNPDPEPDIRIITVEPAPGGDPPNGVITSPSGDMLIEVGNRIEFLGSGDPSGVDQGDENGSYSFHWTFDGVTADRFVQNPGSVVFNEAGLFTITYTVTDGSGLSDPSPDTRLIQVLSELPDGRILEPRTDRVIRVGDTVRFEGEGSGSDEPGSLSYKWDFAGGADNIGVASAGPVMFEAPGVYDVIFMVTNSEGIEDPTPDTRRITVRACPGLVHAHQVVVQGLEPAILQNDILCADLGATWFWQDSRTGATFGEGQNPFILPGFLETSTWFAMESLDPVSGGVERAEILVLVPADDAFVDINGDGCHSIADLHLVLPQWLGSALDADRDGLMTVLDMLYISTNHPSRRCPQ